MTETTRPNLRSTGEDGSRVWYRDSDTEREIPLARVRRVKVRMGDDSRVQGPFKLAATKMWVDQIHNSTTITEQSFESVNRPGVLLNVDGQLTSAVHGTEIASVVVDKSTEKVVDKTTTEREIVALGLWAQVVDRRASTQVYTNITVAEAIKRVLEAINVPYGRIDPTPGATLNYFWLSDKENVVEVLNGLANAAGHRARLDDYTGAITFTAEPSGEDRLQIYGGEIVSGWATASEMVTARTTEGYGVYTGGPGVLPQSARYGGFPPFQASLAYRYDHLNERASWFVQPYVDFTYDSKDYTVELIKSGFDPIKQRYYIEAVLVSEAANGAFSESTFNIGGQAAVYLNWQLAGTTYLRKRFTHASTAWTDLTERTDDLASVSAADAGTWYFSDNEVEGSIQHRGRFRFEVTRAIAEAVGDFTFTVTQDQDACFTVVSPPGESERLIFSDWKRNDDDSRYFNSVKVTSVVRTLDTNDSDLWSPGEDISVIANASTTIKVESSDGTPFLLADPPFTYTANDDLDSITVNRTSGSEVEVTITAGDNDLVLENLVARGKYYAITQERVLTEADNGAIADDGEIFWESVGKFPIDLDFNYLESWIEGRLQLGLERRWTATLDMFGWDSGEDDWIRNNWQTLMRLRPGRLVQVTHGRATWLGLTREIERTSGVTVDHVDRYRVTCELTGLAEFATDILRVGLDNYGSNKVLG